MTTETTMANTKTPTVRTQPAAPKSWHHGLSKATADELTRRGYASREDAQAFVRERPRFHNKRRRETLYDPRMFDRPWLRNGMPMRVSVSLYNEVRQWLGAPPVE
jgi:hypothetical protein